MGAFMLLVYAVGGVLALVVGAVLCFAGYIVYVRSKLSHLPSPKLPRTLTGFFMGHLAVISEWQKATKNDEDPCLELYNKWCDELGNPGAYVIYFSHLCFVIITNPENIKEVVMQVKHGKIKMFEDVTDKLKQRFIKNSLLSILDYNTWKPRRKLYDPSFNKGYLKTLLPSFNECCDKLLDGIRSQADGKTTVYMKQHLKEVTLNVISKVAFGSDFNDQWDDKSLGLKTVKGNGKLTFLIDHSFKGLEKVFNTGFWFPYLHPFEVQGYRETIRALRIIGRDCIMKRIKAVEDGEQIPRDILSSILQIASTKECVDIEELVDDFVVFYVAGQETTSNLLSTTMVVIHQHPDIQYRLQAEVEEVLEGRTEVTHEDLEKLQYTEQILLEVLRLYPPAAEVGKEVMKGGIKLPVGEYFLPEETMMILRTSIPSRMPQYFDNPDSFDPTRFNPENKQPSSFTYFPFGIGHRSCIGKHFALMEAKLILARLVQTFRFTFPPDYKLVLAQRGTLQPKDDVPCVVTPTTKI